MPRKLLEGGLLGASYPTGEQGFGGPWSQSGFLFLISTKDTEVPQSLCGCGLFWTTYKLLWHIKRRYLNTSI